MIPPTTTAYRLICGWFVLCDNPADAMIEHPILGPTPICERCANVVGIVLDDIEIDS